MLSNQHTLKISIGLAAAALMTACAAKTPSAELIDARRAYSDATHSNAQKLEPARVLSAQQALEAAERAHQKDPQSLRERSLAYIAEREAQYAIACGNTAAAKQSKDQAEKRFVEIQGTMVKSAQSELSQTKEVLEGARNQIDAKNETIAQKDGEISAERDARMKAEEVANAAIESLKKIAAVKEDARGLVITLSGEVLFETGKATLLPLARTRLEQVAVALKDNTERSITILGHTDSRGSDSLNLSLSQQRADAVREFLVSQDIEPSRVRAVGKGEQEPVATNDNSEGRANNRRVEIVLGNG